MPRWIKFAAPALVLLLLSGMAGFAPLVRAKARSRALQRGVEVTVKTVRPGWGRVWLRDVRVTLPDVPAVTGSIAALEVGVTPTFRVTRVVAHGANIEIRGQPQEVQAQLVRWRRKQAASPRNAGSGIDYRADGVHLAWHVKKGTPPHRLWGLRYRRDGGKEHLAADLAHVADRGLRLETTNPRIEVERVDGERQVSRIAADAVLALVNLADARKLLGGAKDVKSTRPAEEHGKTALAVAKKSGPALVGGSTKSGQPGASEQGPPPEQRGLRRFLNLSPDRGRRLRDLLKRFARVSVAALPERGELDLSGVRLQLTHRKERLSLGPARLQMKQAKGTLFASLVSGAGAKQPLTVKLSVPLAAGDVRLKVAGGPIRLSTLGVQEGDLGLKEVKKARLKLRATAVLTESGGKLRGTADGQLANLSIQQKWLASKPVRGIDLGFRGRGELRLDGSRIDIEEGELSVGKVRVEANGTIERFVEADAAQAKIVLEGAVPLASCQAMLDSLPQGLAPLLTGMRMGGTFTAQGRLELDTRHPEKVVTRWSVGNECRITATPADISPSRFARTWTREVRGADRRLVQVRTGPGTPTWVPRHSISRHMETAVLICEDGAFFRHDGFHKEAIVNSIRENLKAGRFLRGASTISMQLAKNLYLKREKTLSRKLQEAVLTQLLEQELSKDQIMELYLNVIEFGPGVYGVGSAAAHYFNASPAQLSLGQALYMASILPNPRIQHFAAGGAVSPGWSNYLRKLMKIAKKIRRISEDELADALREQVTYKVPYSPRLPAEDEEEVPTGEAAPPPPPIETY